MRMEGWTTVGRRTLYFSSSCSTEMVKGRGREGGRREKGGEGEGKEGKERKGR
jgi:hypothetical protein